jgi:hypothetical protein
VDLECEPTTANWTLQPMAGNRYGPGLQYAGTLNSTDPDCAPEWGDVGFKEQHIAGYIVSDNVLSCKRNGTQPRGQRWWLFALHVELDNKNRTFSHGAYRDGQ